MSRGFSYKPNVLTPLLIAFLTTLPMFHTGLHAQDDLEVIVGPSYIRGMTIRDTTAAFPYPVITHISVLDSSGFFVHGLANKTRWLLPSEVNEDGQLVDDVWSVLLEYHEKEFTESGVYVPSNPNIKDPIFGQQTPEFYVTEIAETSRGLSVALAMDYSGSMESESGVLEEAARFLVKKLGDKGDRGAVVKFDGMDYQNNLGVYVYSDFTDNTAALRTAVNTPPVWDTDEYSGTALYDGMYKAVQLCRIESLRNDNQKALIVYTDGGHHVNPGVETATKDDVIELAQEGGIYIFTIGIGNIRETKENILKEMATETGGMYLRAKTVEDMKTLYARVLELFRGDYWLAHTSTDPFFNGSWRLVDVSITTPLDTSEGVVRWVSGQDTSKYYVPKRLTDLGIEKSAVTEWDSAVGGETRYYAETLDTISYRLRAVNLGPYDVGNFRVWDSPPPSVHLFDFSIAPDSLEAARIGWTVPYLKSGEGFDITYSGWVDTLRSDTGPLPLPNIATIVSDADSAAGNNLDEAIVYYFPLMEPDPAVSKSARGDSLGVDDGLWYVSPADTVEYTLTVTNLGEIRCRDLEIVDILPGGVTLVEPPQRTYTLTGDTLRWMLDELGGSGASRDYRYRCRVDTTIVSGILPYTNRATVYCEEDTDPENSSDSTTVYYVPLEPADPAVGKEVVGSWSDFEPGFRRWYASPSDTAVYTVTLVNGGELPCEDIRVEDRLPDGVTLVVPPQEEYTLDEANRRLSWTLDYLNSRGDSAVFEYRCVVDTLKISVQEPLINVVTIACESDSNLSNNTATDTLFYVPLALADPAVTKNAEGRWLGQYQGQPVWYVQPGDTAVYHVTVRNTGQIPCTDIEVEDELPAGLTLFDPPLPEYELTGRTLSWTIGRLESRDHPSGNHTKEFMYRCAVDTVLSETDLLYVNSISVTCEDDDDPTNSVDNDTLIFRPLSGVDIDIRKDGEGTPLLDSLDAGTGLWYVKPGNRLTYTITVVNAGETDCAGAKIEESLPEFVEIVEPLDPRYAYDAETRTISWTMGSLASRRRETRTYPILCEASEEVPPWNFPQVNRATVICEEDVNAENDTADHTIWIAGGKGYPQIRVTPSVVDEEAVVQVEVMTPYGLDAWDLELLFDTGERLDTYADAFVASTTLAAGVWTRVDPDFADTWCRTDRDLEPVTVIFEATSWDSTRTANTDFSIRALYPRVDAEPESIELDDPMNVELSTPIVISDWDLEFVYGNGETDDAKADAIKATNPDLAPGVPEDFAVPGPWHMPSNFEQEPMSVVFTVWNQGGIQRTASDTIHIRSSNEFKLSDNVFKPGEGDPLGLLFKLSSNRPATIRIYDLAGAFVEEATMEDFIYSAGWHEEVTWDGTDENGRSVGSGIYIAILSSGDFQKAHKFILVR